MKRMFAGLFITALLAPHFTALSQQTSAPSPALLSAADAQKLTQRIAQLMESTAVAVPGLVQSSAVLAQNVKQAMAAMEANPQNATFGYDLLRQARAYLALSDAVPKPFPFSETARQQFAELRDAVDRLEAHVHAMLGQREGQLRTADRDNLKRYAEANEKIGSPTNRPRVVFLGDSITDGWRLNEYFMGRDFINRGISGQITGEMLGRMKADVIDLRPRALLILGGTNDIARGISAQVIENNLSMMVDLARAHQIKPLIASILPVSDYHKDVNPRFEMTKTRPPAVISEVNRWIQDYCPKHGCTYVDYYSEMVDNAGRLKADLADDGLHPNAKGYRIMAPIAQEAIGRVLVPAPRQ